MLTEHGRKPTILIVDDDVPFCTRLGSAVAQRGYSVITSFTAAEARQHYASATHALIDLRLAQTSGLYLVEECRAAGCQEIVIMTGYGSIPSALEAIKRGAKNYLTKPVTGDTVLEALFSLPLAAVTSYVTTTSSLRHIEWEHIQQVMRDCDNNISRAAKVLGMHRQALQRKLRSPPKS